MSPSPPSDDDVCVMCQRVVIDHSIRELRNCRPGWDHHLPFEEMPEARQQEVMSKMADQVAIAAGTLDTVIGRMPVVVFKFSSSHLGPFDDITFVGDPTTLRQTSNLLLNAVNSAVKAANQP